MHTRTMTRILFSSSHTHTNCVVNRPQHSLCSHTHTTLHYTHTITHTGTHAHYIYLYIYTHTHTIHNTLSALSHSFTTRTHMPILCSHTQHKHDNETVIIENGFWRMINMLQQYIHYLLFHLLFGK